MKFTILRFAFTLSLISVLSQNGFSQNWAQYVNPFIGTGGHGHTFPGPTLPFGMVQLSPDTRLKGWDGCSGYHYSDNLIYGFSHTHLSGTGCSDYGDILIMPTTGKPAWSNKEYASTFQKSTEKAAAGYYSVFLEKWKVLAELTTTTRTGLHKYTFPASEEAGILIDLTHRDKVNQSNITINGDREITGYRVSSKWSSNQYVYFVIQFSKPFTQASIKDGISTSKGQQSKTGKKLKAHLQFTTKEGEAILVKVGISPVSIEGARKNLEAEQPDFNFEATHQTAIDAWNKELGKIAIESQKVKEMRIFYTSFYHAMIAPNVFQDVDGMYRGRDGKNHETSSGYYTVFSLWDTYRALHPLLTIIDKKRTGDFIQTFLLQYDQAGLLPIWELAGYETFCMIGYHALPVIADAYLKGIKGFDAQKALVAMRKSAETDEKGLKKYKLPGKIIVSASFYRYKKGMRHYFEHGYIKNSFMSGSVAKTLEFAYDDWCVAQMAAALDSTSIYKTYIKRAANYQNVYDSSTGFMRARKKNGFVKKFDPFKASHTVYCEANAWQYSLSVPHDVSGHIQLAGGKEKYSKFLDSLFNAPSNLKGSLTQDISGLIGQYAHGNEPSHHISYLYNYTGQPWKTQIMSRRILSELYFDQPDGLPGNEDCGQMSAWYIFSALGIYPVCPGSDHYAISSPLFEKASINLENGQTFKIISKDNSEKNMYIQSASLNGKLYTKSFITYEDIANGGILEFQMGDKPNKNWGTAEGDYPILSLKNN